MTTLRRFVLTLTALIMLSLGPSALAQTPDGSDINKAIPIYLKQVVTDIADATLKPFVVYSITLARGQQVSATVSLTSGTGDFRFCLFSPTTRTVAGLGGYCDNVAGYLGEVGGRNTSGFFNYQVPTAGTYYLVLRTYRSGTNYSFQINADGTPIAIPNPATAGCLNGHVDYVTYSLQFIAAGLPDEVSIGGTKACASCTVKPPLYSEISSRLEGALKANVNVEACYDSGGNIFQLKLIHP